MLEQILRHLRNWFATDFFRGEYAIAEGSLTLPFLLPGQYFRIVGSVFNDGLHQYPAVDLRDETFSGEIWALAIPREVASLAADVAAWQEKNGAAAAGPYQSESFGGYTYTRASDAKTGNAVTWESAFRTRLDAWRKV